MEKMWKKLSLNWIPQKILYFHLQSRSVQVYLLLTYSILYIFWIISQNELNSMKKSF